MATRAYSPDVDRFPHLVVATALRGLGVGGPALWERYDNGDNLLFTEEDYRNPAASKVMRELWLTESPAVQTLVGQLAIACGKPIPQTPWLDQLAPDGEPTPLNIETRREAAAALGIALPVPVSLSPDPGFELIDAPVAAPEHVPMPAAPPKPRPLPLTPITLSDEEVEPSEKEAPAKKKRTAKTPVAAKSNTRTFLFAGGTLLLLVGGIIAGAADCRRQ